MADNAQRKRRRDLVGFYRTPVFDNPITKTAIRRPELRARALSPKIAPIPKDQPRARGWLEARLGLQEICRSRRSFKKTMMKKIAAQVAASGGSLQEWRKRRRRLPPNAERC